MHIDFSFKLWLEYSERDKEDYEKWIRNAFSLKPSADGSTDLNSYDNPDKNIEGQTWFRELSPEKQTDILTALRDSDKVFTISDMVDRIVSEEMPSMTPPPKSAASPEVPKLQQQSVQQSSMSQGI